MSNLFSNLDNYLLTLANGQPADPTNAEVSAFTSVIASIQKNKTFYCFETFVDDDPFGALGELQLAIHNIIQTAQTEISLGTINGFYICNLFYQFTEVVHSAPQGKLIASATITFY
jgi:hypothetical protein